MLQEWREFQVEVTEVSGSRKLILTVNLKHRGESVVEPVSMNPSGPTSLCHLKCWESHIVFGNFFTCSAGYAEQAPHGISAVHMPKTLIGWDFLQRHLRQKKPFQHAWAVPPTMQWTWLSEASLGPAYSQPMGDAMVELAGRCF